MCALHACAPTPTHPPPHTYQNKIIFQYIDNFMQLIIAFNKMFNRSSKLHIQVYVKC